MTRQEILSALEEIQQLVDSAALAEVRELYHKQGKLLLDAKVQAFNTEVNDPERGDIEVKLLELVQRI